MSKSIQKCGDQLVKHGALAIKHASKRDAAWNGYKLGLGLLVYELISIVWNDRQYNKHLKLMDGYSKEVERLAKEEQPKSSQE